MNISSQRRIVGNAVHGSCAAGISRVPSRGHTVSESLPRKKTETITVSMKQFARVHFLLQMSSPLCCVSNSTAVYCIWSRWEELSGHLGGLDFIASAAAPACEVRENLALLALHTRLHLTPPLLGYNWGIDTGRHGVGGPSDLSREAGTFDGLRSLLDLVLVAAAMGCDHLTGPRLHVHRVAPVGVRERRQAQGQQQPPQTHSADATTTFPHSVGAVWCRF